MDISTAKQILENGSRGFRPGQSKVYGQIALRVDNDFYLMTKENIILSKIDKKRDIDVCDMNSGDLGVLFHSRPDINAFVFACTEASVLASRDRNEIRSSLDDFSEMVGSKAQIIDEFSIDKCMKVLKDSSGCIIKGSGIVGVGATIEDAVSCVQIIEKCCKAELSTKKLGELKYIPAKDVELCRDFYINKYYRMNDKAFVEVIDFDESEFEIRNSMIEFGKQICRDVLVFGTWGNISVMINDDEMLITPSGMDYFRIKPEDIVKVNFRDLTYNPNQRIPSRNYKLHARMYRELPGCKTIVHTHSANLSCFAAAHAGFTIADPAMKELIGDVLVTDYSLEHESHFNDNAIEKLRLSHAVILANHGAIFYGPTTELVLAIANAVENTAAAILK